MKNRLISINDVISILLKNNIEIYISDWTRTITKTTKLNHKNFHNINSYLFIGFDNIKNIVFQSISLNNNWLHIKITPTRPNISIIAIQKSTIIFSSSQIDSFHKKIEKNINTIQKAIIKYRNLFLTISLKVFMTIFNIIIKLMINKIIF